MHAASRTYAARLKGSMRASLGTRAALLFLVTFVVPSQNGRIQLADLGGPMPAYVVVEIEVTDPVKYEKYKQLAPPSIQKYGGRYLVRGGEVQALEGKWLPTRFVILQFDSVDQAKAWWNSPEYREAKLLRQASARTAMICVPGHDEL